MEWVSVCPEVEIGLGTPRPTIRLEGGRLTHPRLVEPKSGEDLTERMRVVLRAAGRRAPPNLDLDGYVLKRASPSCGMERVQGLEHQGGMPEKSGVGIFAGGAARTAGRTCRWRRRDRLNDPVLRENFVERVFCRHRWRSPRSASGCHEHA